MDVGIVATCGFFLMCIVGILAMAADSMWRAWLMYSATKNAVSSIERAVANNVVASPAELNTMDCQGGQ